MAITREGRAGALLQEVFSRWPQYNWAGGINKETGGYCLFRFKKRDSTTTIPDVGQEPDITIELAGSSEKDIEVLLTKIALICG